MSGLCVCDTRLAGVPAQAMKCSGSLSLFLVFSFNVLSGQLFVPPGISPNQGGEKPADSTASDTLELIQATTTITTISQPVILDIEMEESSLNSTTPFATTTTTTSATTTATQPLKIEIDMEELAVNSTDFPPQAGGATEPAWHPYLIKITSGTGMPDVAAETTSPPLLSESTQMSTVEDELIIVELPEPTEEETTTTTTATTTTTTTTTTTATTTTTTTTTTPQLIVEELTLITEPPTKETTTRPNSNGSEMVEPLLLVEVLETTTPQQDLGQQFVPNKRERGDATEAKGENAPKRKKQPDAKETKSEGEANKPKFKVPARKQRPIAPTKKQKSRAPEILNGTNISGFPPSVIEASSERPQVYLVITEIEPNVTAPQKQSELPVALQIIGTSTKDTDTRIKDTDIRTEYINTRIKNTDTGTKNAVTGTKIADTGTKNAVTGTKNAVSGTKNSVTHTKNAVSGTKNAVSGTKNSVSGTKNAVTGTKNAVTGTKNAVTGTKNAVTGTKNAVTGTKNADTGTKNADTGTKNADTDVEDTIISINGTSINIEEITGKESISELKFKEAISEPKFKEMYFNQLVDHFSFTNHQKIYRQRYLMTDQFWGKSVGPIFLYTGNEGDVWDFANSSKFIIELASEKQALVIFAEHRYYGKSLPFGKKSYDKSNIGYLTVEQAVADYAVLVTKLKTDLEAEKCPVVAFGGSYGGMLSAYMRIKYPNIVEGALASSAPVISTANIGDGRQFFHDVTKDFERNSPHCVSTIQNAFRELESLAQQQAWSKISNKLSLCKSVKSRKEVDHLYGWARNAFIYLAMFNYPYKTEAALNFPANPVDVACGYILKNSDHIDGLLDILGIFYNSTGTKKCFDIYTEYVHCADPTGCGMGSASQAWDFQTCTEINLLYESNNDTDMFPAIPFTGPMRRNYCHSKWGVYPNPEWLKIQYWGNDFEAASNIIFSNGDLDPWANGGILKNVNPSVVAFVIEGGAHHLDLRASNPADPPSVTAIRKMESNIISEWVKKHQLRNV